MTPVAPHYSTQHQVDEAHDDGASVPFVSPKERHQAPARLFLDRLDQRRALLFDVTPEVC